ncbi:MAG: hypothetical protein M3Y59_11885 [Myxococcota bacterium]|nr:hypothetical protein [Myxococcota bacterium]
MHAAAATEPDALGSARASTSPLPGLVGHAGRLDEQRRRRLVQWGLPLALLLGVAAWFAPRSHFSFGRNKDEEARLAAHLGNASGELAAERRHAAATLLGVTPNAPRAVIEAAFQAQLQERDRSRYDGVAVDLVRVAEEQRAQLQKARDYLLQRR